MKTTRGMGMDGYFARIIRKRFGFNLYILYHQEDGETYAHDLAVKLAERGYHCVLGSGVLPVTATVPKASRMIFIASPEAVLGDEGELVKELNAFRERDLPMTRIRLPGYSGEDWSQCRYGAYFPEEVPVSEDALKVTHVSEVVLSRIDFLCRHEKRALRHHIRQSLTMTSLWVAAAGLSTWTLILNHGINRDRFNLSSQFAARCQSHSKLAREAFAQGARWQGNQLLAERSLLAWQGVELLPSRPSWLPRPKSRDLSAALTHHILPMKLGEIPPPLRHDDRIQCVAFSPDGTRIATGGTDQFVAIWDAPTGKLLQLLTGHRGAVYALAFDRSGKKIATSGADLSIRIWDVEKGISVKIYAGAHQSPTCSVAFHPDGSSFVSAGRWDGQYKTWNLDLDAPQQIRTLKSSLVNAVGFNQRGDEILVAGNQGWERYDASSGVLLSSVQGDEAYAFHLSSDGENLALLSSRGGLSLRSKDGTAIKEWNSPDSAHRVIASLTRKPQGEEWMACIDGRLTSFSSSQSQGTVIQDFSRFAPAAVAFHPSLMRIALGSGNQLEIFDLESGERLLPRAGHRTGVTALRYNEEGTLLLSGSSDGTLRTWNTSDGSLSGFFPDVQNHGFQDAVFALGDSIIIGCGQSISMWDLASQELIRPGSGLSTYRAVSIGSGSHLLITLNDQNEMECWDAQTGGLRSRFRNPDQKIRDFCCSKDGSHVITVGDPSVLRLWDAAKGELISELIAFESPPGEARTIAINPRIPNQAAVGFNRHEIVLCNLDTGEVRFFDKPRFSLSETLSHTVPGSVMSQLTFSPDGSLLACCGGDHSIWIWDVASGAIKHTLTGASSPVKCIDFSPDGRRIAAGTDDGGIVFWTIQESGLVEEILLKQIRLRNEAEEGSASSFPKP